MEGNIIIGIDPGTNLLGYGIISVKGGKASISAMGVIDMRRCKDIHEKLVHDFGKFSEKEPVQKCTFVFKNIGDAPLIIKQVITSCGCTTRTFTEEPVMPGEKGQINITYDGKGRYTKPFRKIITVESNAKTKYVRLHVVGQMTAAKTEK